MRVYLPTTLGLPLVAHKAVLVPTAHDERPIYLDLFRSLFRIPRGLIFQVEEERAFVDGRFHTAHLPSAVIGAGIDPVAASSAMYDKVRQLCAAKRRISFGCKGKVVAEAACTTPLPEAKLAWQIESDSR